ncbi:hypothetical protein [Rhizobacter fulvus]
MLQIAVGNLSIAQAHQEAGGGLRYVADLAVPYRTAAPKRPGYFEVMFSRVRREFNASTSSRRFGLTTFKVLKAAIASCGARFDSP